MALPHRFAHTYHLYPVPGLHMTAVRYFPEGRTVAHLSIPNSMRLEWRSGYQCPAGYHDAALVAMGGQWDFDYYMPDPTPNRNILIRGADTFLRTFQQTREPKAAAYWPSLDDMRWLMHQVIDQRAQACERDAGIPYARAAIALVHTPLT